MVRFVFALVFMLCCAAEVLQPLSDNQEFFLVMLAIAVAAVLLVVLNDTMKHLPETINETMKHLPETMVAAVKAATPPTPTPVRFVVEGFRLTQCDGAV
jgi:hypothetical protein